MDLMQRMFEKYPKNFANCYDFSIGEGWNDLVERLIDQVIALDPEIQIDQIKEKFGGLRFYTGGTTDDVHYLIECAEDASERTCDVCGSEGITRENRGWLACRCEIHK